MIISKEIRPNPNSPIGKELCVSYVKSDGGIGFFQHLLTQDDWFEWSSTRQSNATYEYEIDRNTGEFILDESGQQIKREWRSFYNEPVRKDPLGPNANKLSNSRINEILNSYGNRIDYVFEMYKPKICYVDIETLVTEDSGFPDADEATMPITTISLTCFPKTIIWAWKSLTQQEINWVQEQIDTYSEKQASNPAKRDITKGYQFEFRCFENEHQMLSDFLNYVNNYTAIAGWNFLQYDWKYIHNRAIYNGIDMKRLSPTMKCENFSLQPRVGGHKISLELPLHKIIFDYMLIIQNWDMTIDHPENYKLDYIAERVLSVKKVNHEWGFAEFYKDHFKEYVFYNAIDTILIEQMDKAIETASVWYMLASILRIDLNAAYSTITPVESVICNYIYPDYKVFTNADKKKKGEDIEQEKYEGAFVWPTRPAINRMVMGLDFASLYPTIMRQFGISPEVFVEKNPNREPTVDEIKTASGAIYRKDSKAIVPAILTHYFGLRKQAKADKKQADAEAEYYKKILEQRQAAARL